MRRIAILAAGILSSFGVFAMSAPAAHADPIHLGETITITPPHLPSTTLANILTVCLTVHEINFGPSCVTV